MPASFQEILNSRLFKFIVGEKVDGHPTEFHIHEEAIAQLSKPLESLMKNGMTESQAACAVWEDVSKETFERFSQFAYTGDYEIPKMEVRKRFGKKKDGRVFAKPVPVPEPEPEPEPEPVPDSVPDSVPMFEDGPTLATWGLNNKKGKNRSKRLEPALFTKRDKYQKYRSRILSADFYSLSFPLLVPRNNHADRCEPAATFDPEFNYNNALLGHAALYLLADYRLIDSLKTLSIYKLHKTLCVFELDDENAQDVIDLARYVYSTEGETGVEELRGLVCRYMATHALVFSLNEGFIELLGEGGQFVQDFFEFVVQRVN